MYIYWEECEQGQLLKVPDNVSWQLSCENYGTELNLHVGEETYSIHDGSASWLSDYPRMEDFLVEEYHTAVVAGARRSRSGTFLGKMERKGLCGRGMTASMFSHFSSDGRCRQP